MNKRNVKQLLGMLMFGISALTAREFRTPTVFEFGYPYDHYPFCIPADNCWNLNLWAAGFHRTAGRAFLNKNTTKKEDLSAIFFGKESFLGIDAFATDATLVPGDSVVNPVAAINPLLQIAIISPRIDYRENSAYFGFDVSTYFGCDCQWQVGLRANLPYKDIRVGLDSCCNLEDVTLEDLLRRQDEVVVDAADDLGIIERSYAYRLDLLSLLNMTANPNVNVENSQGFVNYRNPDNGPDDVTMANDGINVTNRVSSAVINLVKKPLGNQPAAPFARRGTGAGDPTAVANLPVLPNDGSGGADGDRFVFGSSLTNDYTALAGNQANQAQLWVVPTASGLVSNSAFDINADARAIQENFERVIQMVNSSAVGFFTAQGVSFDTQRNMGVGDLNTELYVRRDWCNFFFEGIFGVFFPTGKRIKHPERLLLVPTGNNRHFEVKVGGYFGWNACDWFGMYIDAFYSHALKRKEWVAASFAGATVKNMGPRVLADVSWGRFVGNIDFTFSVPCIDPCLGFDVGYQAYVKLKDKVDFTVTTTLDFFGVERMLDPQVIEERTKQVAHKAKGEVFYDYCSWSVWAGFQHVFAGKNAPNDTDWYLGFGYYF